MRIVDTDVLIDIQRGSESAVAWVSALDEPPAVVGFSAMELVQGARNAREVEFARKLLAPLTIVWPSETDCENARALFESLHVSHRLGLLDALIAATATGLDAEFYTHNTKHFRGIEGLRLAQPYPK